MSFVEFLGLMISFVALLVLSVKQSREKRQRVEHPELYEQQMRKRQQSMRELFRSMNIELENEVPPRSSQPEDEEDEEELEPVKSPPVAMVRQPKAPPRMVGGQYALKYNLDRFKQVRPIDQRHLKSAIDQRKIGRQVVSTDMAPDIHLGAYSLTTRVPSSPGRDLVRSLKSPRDMIILHEILDQPWMHTRHYPPKSRNLP